MTASFARQTTFPTPQTALRSCCLMTDGNAHRADLNQTVFAHPDLFSEAMLPEIRTIATLIAAERHRFQAASPAQFTEEADWFAARILVLRVRQFHLTLKLLPMLQIANQRAQAFAFKHNLPFQTACIRASLHTSRPANMLLMECELHGKAQADFIANTMALKPQLCQFSDKLS